MRNYSLIGHDPIPFDDVVEWAHAFALLRFEQRTVGRDQVGDVLVSTVFLGVDHSFDPLEIGPPILFETMTFGSQNEVVGRYATWDEARAGHEAIVAAVRSHLVGASN